MVAEETFFLFTIFTWDHRPTIGRPFFLLLQRVSFAFDLWIHFPSSPFFCAIFSSLNGIEFFPADFDSPNFQ